MVSRLEPRIESYEALAEAVREEVQKRRAESGKPSRVALEGPGGSGGGVWKDEVRSNRLPDATNGTAIGLPIRPRVVLGINGIYGIHGVSAT